MKHFLSVFLLYAFCSQSFAVTLVRYLTGDPSWEDKIWAVLNLPITASDTLGHNGGTMANGMYDDDGDWITFDYSSGMDDPGNYWVYFHTSETPTEGSTTSNNVFFNLSADDGYALQLESLKFDIGGILCEKVPQTITFR